GEGEPRLAVRIHGGRYQLRSNDRCPTDTMIFQDTGSSTTMQFTINRQLVSALAIVAVAGCATAPQVGQSSSGPQTTSAAITAADLRHRLFIYSDDSMMGRKAGTEGNNKATTY